MIQFCLSVLCVTSSSIARHVRIKFENKCLEVKHLKAELEVTKKEKNTLSVAQKTSKLELKEALKECKKKVDVYEKK